MQTNRQKISSFSTTNSAKFDELFRKMHTSDYCVIKEDEDDEGGVEEGEGDEQLVEGVVHLLGGEHRHREQVATEADHTDQRHQDAL